MVSDANLILLAALVGFLLVGVTVEDLERPKKKVQKKRVSKGWLGGCCGAVLAGGSVAELTTGFGKWAETHPIFTGTLTGAALLGITVLVIDTLIKRAAARPWRGPLEGTWRSVVVGGRRGAYDLRPYLGVKGDADRVTDESVPEPEKADPAHEMARNVWIDVSSRVGDASLFAFAYDEPELGDSMQKLSRAADTLHRVLWRYSSQTLPHVGIPPKPKDIEKVWRDYVSWVLEVERLGCHHLGFSDPLHSKARDTLEREKGSHALPTSADV